jgi:hypothetical protein
LGDNQDTGLREDSHKLALSVEIGREIPFACRRQRKDFPTVVDRALPPGTDLRRWRAPVLSAPFGPSQVAARCPPGENRGGETPHEPAGWLIVHRRAMAT